MFRKETIIRIFRIENPETMCGMWYDRDGNPRPLIKTLTEGISAHLPMEPHPRYGKNGRRWYSGCADFSSMRQWFSDRDALELHERGYRLFSFESVEYEVEENQVLFTREGVLRQEELKMSTIFPILLDQAPLVKV